MLKAPITMDEKHSSSTLFKQRKIKSKYLRYKKKITILLNFYSTFRMHCIFLIIECINFNLRYLCWIKIYKFRSIYFTSSFALLRELCLLTELELLKAYCPLWFRTVLRLKIISLICLFLLNEFLKSNNKKYFT